MGGAAIRDKDAMIAAMDPVLITDEVVFCSFDMPPAPAMLAAAIGCFREAEDLSLILPKAAAAWADTLPMRQITLKVHSSLEGVGLTAAVSSALAAADIPCNMVVGYHHDHVFVPSARAEAALAVLQALSDSASGRSA